MEISIKVANDSKQNFDSIQYKNKTMLNLFAKL